MWLCRLLFVLYLTAVSGQFQCSFSATDGTYYNLNGVTLNAALGDYQGSDADSVYVMNVCQICNTGGPCAAANGTICQYNNGGLAVFQGVLATLNTPYPLWSQIDPSSPTKGVKLTYTNSGTCENGLTRTTTVYLECDPNAPLKGTMSVANDSTACTYDFHLITPNSCPITQNIVSLTPGRNATSTIPASSFTYWYIYVLNISDTAEMKITLLQQDPTAFGNLYLYIRYGALPTTQSYDRIDASYSLSHELVIRTTDNPEDNPLRAGGYYIGIQSFGYNTTYLLRGDQFACPGNCNGHGICVNQACACDFGWTMSDCGSSVQDANWDQTYNNTLYNTQVAYYRVNIADPNEYQMVVNVARLGGYAIGSIAVGAGYYPTLTKNDGLVRDSLSPGPALRLTMQNPNLGTGIWLIGVFGQDDEVYNYSVTIHLFDCPNNCSENGVCNPTSHVCNCDADWAGTSDCSQYQETLIKTITSSFYLPAWQTLYFKIEVTDADLMYDNDMTITLQSAPGAGSPPNVYAQYGVFPTYKNYFVTGPSPRKSSQVLIISKSDIRTGTWYVAMQSEDPADHPGSIKYQFENDCSFCVHGTCDIYTYLCTCDNGWEGAGCDVESPSSASGTSVGVTVALVFIFLFVGIAAGVLIKRQFPSLCGESATRGSVQNERELIPKYSAL